MGAASYLAGMAWGAALMATLCGHQLWRSRGMASTVEDINLGTHLQSTDQDKPHNGLTDKR